MFPFMWSRFVSAKVIFCLQTMPHPIYLPRPLFSCCIGSYMRMKLAVSVSCTDICFYRITLLLSSFFFLKHLVKLCIDIMYCFIQGFMTELLSVHVSGQTSLCVFYKTNREYNHYFVFMNLWFSFVIITVYKPGLYMENSARLACSCSIPRMGNQ